MTSLFRSGVFNLIIKTILFGVAFLLSFTIGDMLEIAYEPFGNLIAKLVPALIFFLIFDKMVKFPEDQLLKKRVKGLNESSKAIEEKVIQRRYFLDNFTAED